MSAPDLSSLGQGASDVLSSFGFVVPFALLLLLGWATYRTGSTHLLLSRVWLLLFGKLDVSDQAIEGFLAKRDAFMKFRLVTGLKPRTLEQAKALIAWCDERKEDVGDVKACGHFFDVEKLQLSDKLLGKRALVVTAVLMFFFFLCAYVAGAAAVVLPPAFKVNASGNWYWVDEDRASQIGFVWSDGLRVGKASCQTQDASDELVSDAKVLCQLLDEDSAPARASALKGQRIILGVAGVTFCVLWLQLVVARRQIRASRAMEARLSA